MLDSPTSRSACRRTRQGVKLALSLLALAGCEELPNPPGNGGASLDGSSADATQARDAATEAGATAADSAVVDGGTVLPADAGADAGAGTPPKGQLPGFSTRALQPEDSRAQDEFGGAVALDASGQLLVVGATRGGDLVSDAYGNMGPLGRVFSFTETAGTFSQTQQLRPPVDVEHALFGYSLAMDEAGQVLVVSAPGTSVEDADGPLSRAGKAFVYLRQNGQWVLDHELVSESPRAGNRFGTQVELSGDGRTLLVHEAFGDGALPGVHIYVREGGAFQPLAGTVQGAPDVRHGRAMALDYAGDVLAFSAPGRPLPDPAHSAQAGAVDIYVRDGAGYRFAKTLLPDFPYAGTGFGSALTLSRDGRSLGVITDNYTVKEGCSEHHTRIDAYVFEGDDGEFTRTAFYPAMTSNQFEVSSESSLAFDAQASLLVLSTPLEPAAPPAAFDAPHGEQDLRGSVFLLARGSNGWAAPHALKIAHPEFMTYGGEVALDATGSRLVVGSELHAFGYEEVVQPQLPPGLVWVHDVDPQAAKLPVIAATAPGTTTSCDTTRPDDLPAEVCWTGNASRIEAAPYCPAVTCFDGEQLRSVPEAATARFSCVDGAECLALPGDFVYEHAGHADLELTADDLTIHLGLDLRLLADGLTLENFRRYVTHASAQFSMAGDGGYRAETNAIGFGGASSNGFPHGTIEFLAYEAGTLHLRISAPLAVGRYTRGTPPYPCPVLGGIAMCTQTQCTYSSGDVGDGSGAPSGWADIDVVATLPLP